MPDTAPSPIVRTLLLRLADDELPAWFARWLHLRVRTNPMWSRWYDAIRQSEHAATPGDAPLSAAQHTLLRSMILDDPRIAEAAPTTARTGLIMGLGVAATAAVLLWPRPAPGPDDFVARGADLRLRLRCVDTTGAVVADALAAEDGKTILVCGDGSLVAIVASNARTEAAHVIVEVTALPGEATTRPLRAFTVGAGATDVVAEDALRLDGIGQRQVRLVDVDSGLPRSSSVTIHVGGEGATP